MGERAQVARGLCRLVSSERVSSSEFRRSQEEDLQPFCQHASLMGEGGGVAGDKVVEEHVGQIVTLVPFGGSITYHNNSL